MYKTIGGAGHVKLDGFDFSFSGARRSARLGFY